MGWDQRQRERYEKGILEEARQRKQIPADLFARYGIDARLKGGLRGDDAAFSAHTAEMAKYWRSKQRGKFKTIATQLLAAHTELERAGRLTFEHFDQASREAAEQARREAREMAQNLTTTHIDRSTLTTLLDSVEGLTSAQIEQTLRTEGVQVVDDLPDLPTESPTSKFNALREACKTRGADFSPEVVFGAQRVRAGFTVLKGFRLKDGGRLDDAAMSKAAKDIELEPYNDRKTAADRAISILKAERGAAGRDAVVLWEIVADLRRMPAGVAERGLAQRWVRRGLDEDEAGMIATAVRQGGAVDTAQSAENEVRSLLAENQLRAAQRAAAGLPSDHDLHTRIRQLDEQVGQASSRAMRHLRAGETEEAVQALTGAIALAEDDDALASRLTAIPPLPAEAVRARASGSAIIVSWTPSPSQTDDVSYEVVRRSGKGGAAQETHLATTGDSEVTDDRVSAGTEVRYHVVAVRGEGTKAAAAASSAVMLTPDVEEVSVTAHPASVTGTWRAPPQAARVEVLRGENRPPKSVGDGVRVDATETGFRDNGVQPGTQYYYRVQAVYLTPEGRSRMSTGVMHSAAPAVLPDPVTDVDIAANETTGFTAAWTPPANGEVIIRRGAGRSPWSPGDIVGIDDVRGFGPELPRADRIAGSGKAELEFSVPAGRHYLMVTTVSAGRVAIGAQTEVTRTEAVRMLRADRLGPVVRLSWSWPKQATTVLVSWSGADGTVGERRCSRRSYEHEGGFEVEIGYETVHLEARAIVLTIDGELTSAPVRRTLAAMAVVKYHIQPAGLLRKRRKVEISVDRACELPELLVVYAPGAVQPYSADQGEVVARVPAQHIDPGRPVAVEVTPSSGSVPGWLMCFAANDREARTIELRQPSVKELKIR